jgi:lipopolysaccharide transport system ATP-binding protein
MKLFSLLQKTRARNPPLFHVTHAKAGSSWLYKIFKTAYGDRVPKRAGSDICALSIEKGKLYSAIFCNYRDFKTIPLAVRSPHFFVMRDLRDTIVSLYFSHKYSHVPNKKVLESRLAMEGMSDEEGIMHCFRETSKYLIGLQRSWMESTSPIYKYEDLFESKGLMLLDILDDLNFDFDRSHLLSVINENTFKRAFGRNPGEVDINSHGRSGVSGSWKAHRSDEMDEFIERELSRHIELTGYEV